MSSAPKPIVAPSARQRSSSVSWSISTFSGRVARVARSAAAGPAWPVRSSSPSISLRRFEKCVSTFCGMPAMSATWSWTGRHRTPSRRVISSRSAVWNTTPAASLERYRAWPSSALQRPSGPRVRLATRTWVWSCGSPARLVRWRKPAAMNPAPGRRRVPHVSNGATLDRRLFDPRRTKHASRSSHDIASSTAVSTAATISARTIGSANAYITLTDFGAENVRSKPGTRFLKARICVPFGDRPVPGTSPARIARRSSPSTASGRLRMSAAVPNQRPAVSPAPE